MTEGWRVQPIIEEREKSKNNSSENIGNDRLTNTAERINKDLKRNLGDLSSEKVLENKGIPTFVFLICRIHEEKDAYLPRRRAIRSPSPSSNLRHRHQPSTGRIDRQKKPTFSETATRRKSTSADMHGQKINPDFPSLLPQKMTRESAILTWTWKRRERAGDRLANSSPPLQDG